MTSSAPEPQPEEKADAASASAGIQPSSDARAGRGPPEPPLPSVPDHELLRCIGRGAYGAVWLARNVMGTFRAVKIVHREDFTRDRPFTREYEGLLHYEPISRSHPNLMQILHVGRRESYFYYVTELADDAGRRENVECRMKNAERLSHAASTSDFGLRTSDLSSYVPRTLQEDLERRGRLPVRECIGLATALASALKHLHNCGLVHRDVKPSNVILVHGVAKLADIGLVATVGDSRSIVGTEGYLPPEGPGNPQADLYSLGKLLYEVSTGLNRGEYPRLPPNLGALPDAPELLEFNEVLLKACAKDTARRYHQAEDLLADLALLERGDSVKRLRRLERHHALLKRIGIGALVVGLLVSAAWWQSWRAQRIATRHLAQLHVNEGTRRMVQGDYAAALPWLVGALELEAGDSRLEKVHRTRIASVLQHCPLPVAHFSAPDSRVVTADLSPDGAVVATAHADGWVRLWDIRSQRQIRQLPHAFPVSVCQFLPSGDRLLTVTMRQEAHVWHLARPEAAPLTFPQAQGATGDLYALGLNEALGMHETPESPERVFLSKGRYCFPWRQPYRGRFENVTLALKLIGKEKVLLVKSELRRAGLPGAVFYTNEFCDSLAADPFQDGSDDPAEPLWGKTFLALENGSWGDTNGEGGEVIWAKVRTRRYPSGERPPPPWRVLDDFSSASTSNWVHVAVPEEGRSCQATNGQLVLSCACLPTSQGPSGGVIYREPLEISHNHTLEVEVDLIAARAPHRMVSLALCRWLLNPLTAPDRPFIAQGRWLATTWWDAPIRLFDLETAVAAGVNARGRNPPLELGRPGHVWDIDFSPDMSHVALVRGTNELSICDLRTRQEVEVAATKTPGANGARFSPDGRFLAVSYGHALALIRTSDWQVAHTFIQGASFTFPRFAPRGYRLAAVRDNWDLVVWDLDNLPEPLATFPHQAAIQRLAFSPDGRYLATSAGDRMVRIWDVVRGEAFGPPLPGVLVRFNPDGTQLLVIGREGVAWLWDVSRIADQALAVPPLRTQGSSASSLDGTMTAEIEGQGLVLKLPTARHSLVHPVPLHRVAFTPGDEYLIAEGSDLLARIWNLPTLTLAGPPRPVRYEVSLTNHPQLELPVEQRPLHKLRDLAALLGGQRPDRTGGIAPVDEAERTRILGELQRAHPAEFTVDNTNRWRWHREQAQAAESDMDWDAAVFHWERCQRKAESRKQKAEIPVESRLAYARRAAEEVRQAMLAGDSRWSRILPRPPWATSEMLDLHHFYTQPLGEPLVAGRPSTSFRGLASGVQTLGGTGFDVRGIIHLKLTNHVEISIGRACKRVHFLHVASQTIFSRETAATYQVTYVGGAKAPVALRNPDEVAPFTWHRFHEVSAPSRRIVPGDVHSHLAWSGYARGPSRQKEVLYLTRATWELPEVHQGEVVKSIELQAGPAQSAPLVFAITVE
jgi:serine/threonine protein kinase/WD40 repeat protein